MSHGVTDLEHAVADVAEAEQTLATARAIRDEEIRTALAKGTPYRELQQITGLSRAMLDAIRRGRTRLP